MQFRRICLCLFLLGWCMSSLTAKEINPRFGFIARQFIVPAPGKVKIDGKLDDWDLSGAVESFPSFHERNKRSGKLAMMYDKDAFYIAGEVTDESPLMNRHDPDANPEKVWNGDSCQVRLVIDRTKTYPVNYNKFKKSDHGQDVLVHLLLWYYTDGKRPGLQLRRDMDYKLPQNWGEHGMVTPDGFDAVYVMWENKKGFTFEYRIPWTALEAPNPPKAGDVVAGTTQFNWSRPDGLAISKGGYARNIVSAGGFPFQTTDVWGKFVFARHGQLPEASARVVDPNQKKEMPTPLKLRYELPKAGQVSLGIYDQKNVLRRQLLAEVNQDTAGAHEIAWDGLDSKKQPLPAGTYRVRGIVSDPIKERFVLAVHNAGTPPYKTDDGTGGWGADHGEPTTVAAAGDKMLLAWSIAESGWGIIRTDLDGDKQWGTKHPAAYLAVWGERFFAAGGHGNKAGGHVRIYELKDARPVTFEGGASDVEAPEGAEKTPTTGLAASRDLLYVAYGAANVIGVHSPKTGKLQKTIKLEAPGRLTIGPDGALYALSNGTTVVRIKDKPEVIKEGLEAAVGIAVDAKGRIYITQGGAKQNVLVIDGKRTRSIGKAGGRPRRGRFEPQGLLEPGGCAVDAKGRLWVAETLDRPKRISVWNTTTGKLVNQYFGGSAYFGWAWIDPKNPTEAFCHTCIWKINLDTGEKGIISTHWRRNDPNEPPPHNPGGYAGHFRVVTAANGAQFGWGQAGRSRATILYMRDGDLLKPVVGQVDRSYPALKPLWERLQAKWDKARIRKHHRPGKLFWQDANNDQKVSPDEVSEKGFRISWVTPDLTLWDESGSKLSPVRFDGKRPVYDLSKIKSIGARGNQGNTTGMAVADPENDGIYTLSPGSSHAFAKWKEGGKLLWSVGSQLNWKKALAQPPMQAGDFWGMTNILGVAGDFTGVSTYFGGYHLFTRDGIYVAMVMRPSSAPGGLGFDMTASECLTGQLVKPEGMNRYFLCAGDQDGRVTELHGLDTVQKLKESTLTITENDAATVAKALQKYEAAQQRGGVLYVQRPPTALGQELAVVEQQVDRTRSWQAQLGWDETHLYLRFGVVGPSPLVNSMQDPSLIFKGGNLMDVQLATNANADSKRRKPAPGDVRLLVSRRPDGKAVAVLLRPKVARFKGEPIVLKSPTGTESFDSIKEIEGVSIKVGPLYEKKGRKKVKVKNAFLAVAKVPLKALGWKPVSGQTIRADIGYIFGNATGSDASLRSYWHNNSFTANVVDDVPHESRLEPQHWGTAVVE